jgi:hypothetical protein
MPRLKKSQRGALTWTHQNVNIIIYDLNIDEIHVGDVQGVPIELLIVDFTQEREILDVYDGEEEQE